MSTENMPLIFISYKHADYSTKIAKKLRVALEVISEALNFRIFLDDDTIRSSDDWREQIDHALGEMTHFIALLTDEYLAKSSTECRRELLTAIQRYEDNKKTKLLFIMVDEINPSLVVLAGERKAGKLVSDDPKINSLGDIHFLGPFNAAKQLVRLVWEDDAILRQQIKQLLDNFQRTLPPADHGPI